MAAAYGAPVAVPRPLLVAVGAVAGAGLRWFVGVLLGDLAALVVVNTPGALALGALLEHELPEGVRRATESTRLLVGVGFCGALTTFSTLAVDVATRLDDGRIGTAAAVLGISLGLGLVAVWTGSRIRRATA